MSFPTDSLSYAWIAAITVGGFVVGIGLAAAALVLLPEDYFDPDESSAAEREQQLHPVWRWTIRIGRNLIGAALVILGVVMLFVPGQGLLTILLGVMLVDFPGKRRLIAKWLARPKMLDKANRWRAKFGKPPLRAPHL